MELPADPSIKDVPNSALEPEIRTIIKPPPPIFVEGVVDFQVYAQK